MDNQQAKVGDVVVLASGGPPMTIQSIVAENGTVFCQWFDAAHRLESAPFPAAVLAPYAPPKPAFVPAHVWHTSLDGIPQADPGHRGQTRLHPEHRLRAMLMIERQSPGWERIAWVRDRVRKGTA